MNMKRWSVAVGCAIMFGSVLAVADDFKASITGTFAGSTVSVTNTTGTKLALSAIMVNKVGTDWSSSTNSKVTLKNPSSSGTFILVNEAATNTLIYSDGAGGIPFEPSGVLAFTMACSTATTNYYLIAVK